MKRTAAMHGRRTHQSEITTPAHVFFIVERFFQPSTVRRARCCNRCVVFHSSNEEMARASGACRAQLILLNTHIMLMFHQLFTLIRMRQRTPAKRASEIYRDGVTY